MKIRQDLRLVPDEDHIRILDRDDNEFASIGLPDGQYIIRDAAGERVGYASSLGKALAAFLQDFEEGEQRALQARQETRRLVFGVPSPTHQ